MRTERNILASLLIMILAVLSSTAQAKGPFQAAGKVTDIRRQGELITFRFSGGIDFGFASAPAEAPAREWKDVHFDVTDLLVQVKDWTEPYKPEQRAASDNVARVHQKLSELASSGGKVQLSIDNPGLKFSNTGALEMVSGTFLYTVAAP